MATKKKKVDKTEDDLLLSTDAKAFKNQPSNGWPKINQGTHLTVKTFEDGRTELIWDDDVLLKEVQNAILKAESNIPVKTTRKSKK